MSQHSDDRVWTLLSEIIDLADCGTGGKHEGLEGYERAEKAVELATQARAVLDEAAKPAPGGPKMREGVTAVITAWEGLSEGYYTYPKIQKWLVNDMAPAINLLRRSLAAPPEPTVPEVPARVEGEGE